MKQMHAPCANISIWQTEKENKIQTIINMEISSGWCALNFHSKYIYLSGTTCSLSAATKCFRIRYSMQVMTYDTCGSIWGHHNNPSWTSQTLCQSHVWWEMADVNQHKHWEVVTSQGSVNQCQYAILSCPMCPANWSSQELFVLVAVDNSGHLWCTDLITSNLCLPDEGPETWITVCPYLSSICLLAVLHSGSNVRRHQTLQ